MKKKIIMCLLAVTLCLSACGNKNNDIEESSTQTEAPAEADTETEAETEAETETAPIVEEATTKEIADNFNDKKTEVSTIDALENAPVLEVQEVANETQVDEIARTECNETVFTNTNANIRIEPNTAADKAGTVKRGTQLTRTAILDNGWSEVTYSDNTCYISSKLISTEQPAVEVEKQPATAQQPAPALTGQADATATAQVSKGETMVKDDITFVCGGQTPNGLNVYHCDWDTGTWPDYLINAYDSCGITNDMSDYDKCVAINNYICSVLTYADYVGMSTDNVSVQCLNTGEASCQGYANAFDYLCTLAGINSRVVGGYVSSGGHAWNRVLINGVEYWVDVCWNDYYSNGSYLMSTSLWDDHTFSNIVQ